MNVFKKYFWLAVLFLAAPAPLLAAGAFATYKERLKGAAEEGGGFAAGTTSRTLSAGVGSIINLVLSFVGVIFLTLVIYAGILWMTAGGNEEKVAKAKKIMFNASIGLAVTLAAYIITITVVDILA